MGKRGQLACYPTDPHASASVAAYLDVAFPGCLDETWLDACGGPGLLLEGLGIKVENRRYIEIDPRHREDLRSRSASNGACRIGDGLLLEWGNSINVALNPPFDNDTMIDFIRRAVDHVRRTRGVAIILTLATFWHSSALRGTSKRSALLKPDQILVPPRRVSCDGSGRGDMRPIDWILYDGASLSGDTRVVWLPPAKPAPGLLSAHRRISGQLGASEAAP